MYQKPITFYEKKKKQQQQTNNMAFRHCHQMGQKIDCQVVLLE